MTRDASLGTERIWEELSDDLRRFLRRRVRSDEVAAELLQETFARIHAKLPTLRDAERLLPWVYRIARNVVTQHYRDRGKAAGSGGLLDVDEATPSEPDDDANLNETVGRWLIEMIDSLPPKYRDALRRSELGGATQKHIGEELGLSLSGAKSRIQRGRELLRSRLLDCCRLELDARGNVIDYEQRGECESCADNDDACGEPTKRD